MTWAELWHDWRVSVGLACLCWGLWAVLSKVAATRLGWPFTMVTGLIAALILVPVVAARGLAWPGFRPSLWAVAAGLLGALGTLFFVRALESGPASAVTPLAEGYMVIAVLLAVLFLGEPLTINRMLGLACMLAGGVLLGWR